MSEIKTILVVDDEPGICSTLAALLETLGHNTLTAHSGNEAIKIVTSQDVDIVISDIKMANGDGVELLENIRKHHPTRPAVVLITGFASITEEEAKKKGALALINKPMDFELIQKTLESALT